MTKTRINLIVAIIATGILTVTAACGSLRPPEECPFTGSADETAFAQCFNRVALVTEGAPLPETGGDSELTFGRNDKLELIVISLVETETQVCIGERKGGGKVVLSQAYPLVEGENRLTLGSFQPNPYVIRIAVNNTLIKNVTFSSG